MPIRVVLERGPKAKKFVAYAVDWPGWSRGAKTADGALETLAVYRERYQPVAERAGLSFSPSSLEQEPMDAAELERKLTLLQACWACFDDVAARVSPGMRKGPRGGGRDRDTIIRHTIRVESEDFAKKVGLVVPEHGALGPGALPVRISRGDARLPAWRGKAGDAIVDIGLPRPPLRLPQHGPRVGDGRQGPVRRGGRRDRRLTPRSPMSCGTQV
jgi:hypothetical protein